jgi:uncharacterized membrane protein (UPF0127 family)
MGSRLFTLSLCLGLALVAQTAAAEGAAPPRGASGSSEAGAADAAAPRSAAPEDAAGAEPGAAPTGDEALIIAPIGDEAAEPPADVAPQPARDTAAAEPAAAACREDTILLRGDFGKARFSVAVADDAETRAKGLMHVASMPPSHGMLFVYPSARPVSFWMKNTLIPLDMIFADRHGVVQRVHSMAKPRDLTQIPGGPGIQYVLEINGGLAQQMGIGPGSQMRHPAIAEPAWRCN